MLLEHHFLVDLLLPKQCKFTTTIREYTQLETMPNIQHTLFSFYNKHIFRLTGCMGDLVGLSLSGKVGLALTGAKVVTGSAVVGAAVTGAKVVTGAITGAAVVGASEIGADVVGAFVLMGTAVIGDAVIITAGIVGVC